MDDDRKYMGSPEEAKAKLIEKAQDWRSLRQPLIAPASEQRARDTKEREARIRLAEAALLWLWHEEHPDAAQPVVVEACPTCGWRRGSDQTDVLACHCQPVVGDAWQDIETAPKSGQTRWLFSPVNRQFLGFWGRGVSEPAGSESWRHSNRWRPVNPTHWRPYRLFTPPAEYLDAEDLALSRQSVQGEEE